MVDFDKDRDANLAAFELTGGCASGGVTVRDYFAAKAMDSVNGYGGRLHPLHIAQRAYEIADAMLEFRQHGKGFSDVNIDALKLSTRTINCLRAESVVYVSQLLRMRSKDLMKIPGMGMKGIKEIQESLATRGLALEGDPYCTRAMTVEEAFGL